MKAPRIVYFVLLACLLFLPATVWAQAESGDPGQSLLADSRKAKRELQTLLHPEMLGRAFQVLALAKNVDVGVLPLAGFKFARELSQSG